MSELNFSISLEKRERESFLVIHTTDLLKGPSRIVYADALLKGKKEEKDLYTFLLKEHLKSIGVSPLSDKLATISITKISISHQRSLEAIKLLALAKKLQFKGKSIFYNPFAKTSVFFQVKEDMAALEVKGYLTVDGNEFPFSDVEMLFPSDPIWCIVDRSAVALPEEVDRNLLLKTYPLPLKLEGRKRDDFIEIYQDDKDVDVRFESLAKQELKSQVGPLEALPILELKDTQGAFANLKMDYGNLGIVSFEDFKGSFRNKELEKSWEKDLLETGFQKKIVGSSHYFCPMDQVAKTLSFLLDLGWKIIDSKGRMVCKYSSCDLSVSLQKEKIRTAGQVNFDDHKTNLQNVVGAFVKRERFVELSTISVGLLDPSSLDINLYELSEAELDSEGLFLKKQKVGLLDSILQRKETRIDPSAKSLIERLSEASQAEKAPPSDSFQGVLYPYQQEGVSWLNFLYQGGLSGLLADDMGLGKTVQVLGFLSRVVRQRPILIVAPTSLIFNWRKEWEKFLPGSAVYEHSGKNREQTPLALSSKEVILTSYTYLRMDIDVLKKVDFECVILDEAQMIKNPESLAAQSAYLLSAPMKIAITGTPIENRWDDLWSLFHFLEPDLLEDQKQFHANMIAAQADDRYLKRVKKKIRPFLLRRTKKEVALDLPEKVLQTVWVEMSQHQREIYEMYLARNKKIFHEASQEGVTKHRMQVLEALLRLRQICCHPHLADKSQDSSMDISPKLERVIADLQEVVSEERKVIVFSQFTEMLKIIESKLKDLGISYAYLDGSTKDREKVVSFFQEDPSCSVFLMSLKAGGVGLNLTAADYVFLFDPWWNDAAESQAIDRAYRLGRKDKVVARRYIMAESVEEKIMKLKEQKSSLAHGLLDLNAEIAEVSLQDLIAMLDS